MKQKLTTLLSSFSTKEKDLFRKYLKSGYFRYSQRIVRFYDVLMKNLNSNKDSNTDKNMLWEKYFNNKGYEDYKLRRLFSDLNKVAEDFLALRVYQCNSWQKKTNLLTALMDKGLKKSFLYHHQQLKSQIQNDTFKDADFYHHRYQTDLLYSSFLEYRKNRFPKNELEQYNLHLDIFYLITKLKFLCNMLNYSNISNVSQKILFSKDALSIIERTKPHNYPALALYYAIFQCLSQKYNFSVFRKLKKLLFAHIDKFSNREQFNLYGFALNHCIRKINEGDETFLPEIFEMYQLGINKKYLYTNGFLSPWSFKNTITTALRLKKTEWAEKFLNENKNELRSEFRENAFNFNKAQITFYQKKFSESKKFPSKVQFEDLFYRFDTSAHYLKIHYETNDIESFVTCYKNFIYTIKNNKTLSKIQKTNYLNFISFTRILMKFKEKLKYLSFQKKNNLYSKIEDIKKKLIKTKNIANITWLKEKVKELENTL